jgi:hypothetical protein
MSELRGVHTAFCRSATPKPVGSRTMSGWVLTERAESARTSAGNRAPVYANSRSASFMAPAIGLSSS